MRRALATLAVLAALATAPGASGAGAVPPWQDAGDVRAGLADAETELVLGSGAAAARRLEAVAPPLGRLLASHPAKLESARRSLAAGTAALAEGDERSFAASRGQIWATVLGVAAAEAQRAAARGDVRGARAWLLVREFRPPTRFSRAAADATLALEGLAAGRRSPAQAAASVRADLLDTYDGRLRASLAAVRDARLAGFDVRTAETAAAARGYWLIVRPSFRRARGAASAMRLDTRLDRLVSAAVSRKPVGAHLRFVETALEGFRAAPLSEEEVLRRAAQLDRFLRLAPIEYGRGVADGRVIKDFEIQEAITFRDGAASAYRDLQPVLFARDGAAARSLGVMLTRLGDVLARASRGTRVENPERVEADTASALSLIERLYPPAWRDAAETADFDVIAATLDRLQAAAARGDWGQAEQARLEAYGVFELGPEQRLRGLAPDLFRRVEGYFWYGEDEVEGLVRLLGRKAGAAELAATRAALDESLLESEQRIGAGPGSRLSIVTNSAIIVFREGFEAVLILAALMASMVGGQRRHRRPLLGGVLLALVASAVTWMVAQTVLGSLARFGERLEAVVSLIAIGVLLLILNWFYHRVYWQENLQGLHRRKKRALAGASVGILSVQALGLLALGFSSVYREGFESVLFLQALTLDAGAWTVLQGALIGLAGVVGVFFLVIALERRLPHKKMLVATGVLITWVLVILVGQTVQTMQKVGWLAVSPVDRLELPYWAGVWFGLYPTWQGLGAQLATAAFVLGSYFGAESLRRRRRARILEAPPAPASAPDLHGSGGCLADLQGEGSASA